MRISDWSSDVCSSDLKITDVSSYATGGGCRSRFFCNRLLQTLARRGGIALAGRGVHESQCVVAARMMGRSEEHTSELQSLMRISYAVFCLKKKNQTTNTRSANL